MANTFKYKITATDDTSKGIQAAEKGFQRLGKTADKAARSAQKAISAPKRSSITDNDPAWRRMNEIAEWNRDIRREEREHQLKMKTALVDAVSGTPAKSLAVLVSGLSDASGGANTLTGAVGKAGLGLAGFAGLAVGAGAAAYAFSKGWITAAANLDNLRATLGMTSKDIQGFEMAGQQFGIEKGAMDQSLAGIGAFAYKLKFDPNAITEQTLARKTGLKVKYDKNGNADVTDLAYQFAELTKNQRNVYGMQQLAQIGGFSSALPAFRQGRAGLQQAVADSIAVGGYMTDADASAGTASRKADVLNQQGLQHVVHLGQKGVAQPVMALEKLAAGGMASVWGSPSSPGPKSIADFHDAVTGIFVPAAKGLESAAGNISLWAKQEAAMRFFISQGRTAAQAAGMVANITRESRFNPNAIGDSGHAFGYGQWHEDRQAGFRSIFGHDMRAGTDQEQLWFYNHEMYGGAEAAAGRRLSAATDDPYAAGAVVSRYDERPRDTAGEAAIRGSLADELYQAFSRALRENPQTFSHNFSGIPAGARVTTSRAGSNSRTVHHFMRDDW